jgi:hypothetical protein
MRQRKAGVPIVFLGKPLVEDDYFKQFLSVADGKTVVMRVSFLKRRSINI